MYCKFCEQEVGKLIDCHIIPRAFFEYMKKLGNIDAMPIITNFMNSWPRSKSRIGWYDPEIVCEKCERIFHPYDDYAIKLLLRTDQKPLFDNNRPLIWMINNYNYTKLKLFFMSVLWRAGASERDEFKKIDLGTHLDKLKKYIISEDPGDVNTFSVVLARFPDLMGHHIQLNPHKEIGDAFGGVDFYRFYMGAGYMAHIKVDDRKLSEAGNEWLAATLRNNHPLIILRRSEIRKSKEFEVMAEMLKNSIELEEKIRKNNRS